jgi:Leucine Rich repeat
MESPESSVVVSVEPQPQKRPQWRLRILVVLAALAVALFRISRLEPEQAKTCGPIIESVYLVFNPPIEIESTEAAKQFIAEMATMGGTASRIAPERGFLGVFGTREKFMVNFSGANLDDAKLDWLASHHADRIESLSFMSTVVTDDGLRHLKRFKNLRTLILLNVPARLGAKQAPSITGSGLAQLDLPGLVFLAIDKVPITDATLNSMPDLPLLTTLQLTGTNIEGAGLARFVASKRLTSLVLSGSSITDEGLGHLRGARGLISLTLYGMTQLTWAGLKNVAAMPSLRYLSLQGCHLPSKDVAQLKASAPELRIEHEQ